MTSPILFFFLFLFTVAGSLTAQVGTVQLPSALDAPLQLQPGDILRIVVWRQDELSGEIAISEEGFLVHPLYRDVQVTGVPISVVEDRLRAIISRYETDSAFVTHPLIRVAVGGQVRSPSLYTLPPETTISQAVALAGGPTDRGRLDRIRLIRGGVVHLVDLTRVDDASGLAPVRSGDQILLDAQRGSFFRSFIVPLFSFVAAGASIVNIFL